MPSQFLSTLSLRRATTHPVGVLVRVVISIHALLAESDLAGQKLVKTNTGISIHALLAESDHAPSRRPCPRSNFYPRSPCGERQAAAKAQAKKKQISIHALLAESDPTRPNRPQQTPRHFYPRSPCGERLGWWVLASLIVNISIHALLAESDRPRWAGRWTTTAFLSTLSLRRATQ